MVWSASARAQVSCLGFEPTHLTARVWWTRSLMFCYVYCSITHLGCVGSASESQHASKHSKWNKHHWSKKKQNPLEKTTQKSIAFSATFKNPSQSLVSMPWYEAQVPTTPRVNHATIGLFCTVHYYFISHKHESEAVLFVGSILIQFNRNVMELSGCIWDVGIIHTRM